VTRIGVTRTDRYWAGLISLAYPQPTHCCAQITRKREGRCVRLICTAPLGHPAADHVWAPAQGQPQ